MRIRDRALPEESAARLCDSIRDVAWRWRAAAIGAAVVAAAGWLVAAL